MVSHIVVLVSHNCRSWGQMNTFGSAPAKKYCIDRHSTRTFPVFIHHRTLAGRCTKSTCTSKIKQFFHPCRRVRPFTKTISIVNCSEQIKLENCNQQQGLKHQRKWNSKRKRACFLRTTFKVKRCILVESETNQERQSQMWINKVGEFFRFILATRQILVIFLHTKSRR